ncbi:MAG: MBL fold metallo-hydrolase [Chloroflexi bacterium]|nr:MBL fold metallo-hydrolase [Chloroflexota bacterium]
MEIVPGIHQIKVLIPDNPLGYLNCYLVEGSKGWLMVDTGWSTPDAFNSLEQGLKSLRLSFKDIETIVITHAHLDHFGLAGRIKQASPRAELICHQWEADLINSRYIKFDQLRKKMSSLLARNGAPPSSLTTLESALMPEMKYVVVTPPDTILYGGETISTGIYDLQVIWAPGHSPGHICLYEPRNKLLFAGDHVLPVISPNVSLNTQSGDNPLGDFLYALDKIKVLPATKVLPAHENIFSGLQDRIEAIKHHHERRKDEILQVISKEPRNAYYISSQITWDVPDMTWEQMPPFHQRTAMTETMAHLECMKWEGKVVRIETDGRIAYLAVQECRTS